MLPSGNRVLISHGNKEYSLLTHFTQNSIQVKKGAKVKQGGRSAGVRQQRKPVLHTIHRVWSAVAPKTRGYMVS